MTDSKLTSEHGHVIPYTLTSRDGGSATTKWEFSPAEVYKSGGTTKPVGAWIDLTGGRPGTYTTSLTCIVSAERVPVDLSALTANYTASDGDILTGTAPANVGVTIPDGAEVTLSDADITSIKNDKNHKYAGITCTGNVTLILSGDNAVKGGHENLAGIFISQDYTLTIKGDGKLTASSNGYGAGIGGGYKGSCGTITITTGVTSVTATAGGGDWSTTQNSIGAGDNGKCGTVTIGRTEGAITQTPYTYPPANP